MSRSACPRVARLLAAGLLTLGFHAAAAPVAVNVDAQGLALKGYDPVAYFTDGKPTPGSAEITAEHQGAIYRFASEAHRDAFRQDPARYVPQYGGFCAYAATFSRKVDTDPEAWKIVEGKLYLNLNERVRDRWEAEIPVHIETADQKWPRIKDIPPGDL
jgi:YHS domain-containing protein